MESKKKGRWSRCSPEPFDHRPFFVDQICDHTGSFRASLTVVTTTVPSIRHSISSLPRRCYLAASLVLIRLCMDLVTC